MRLDHIFDLEVRFKEFFFPRGSAGSDFHAFCIGEGAVTGGKLRGTLRWTNRARRRDDGKRIELGKVIQNSGTWLPHFDGVIRTDDGVELLFSFAGYNMSTGIKEAWHHRAITARITFTTRDDRYLWLNNVYGLLVGRGSWPVDEANFLSIQQTGRYKDDEIWQLSGFACVNEVVGPSPQPVSSSSQPVSGSVKEEIIAPQLRQLFVGDLSIDGSEQFPTSGTDSDWVSYSRYKGVIEGMGFHGEISGIGLARRRSDGLWLPKISGKIKTTGGETILVTIRGYRLPVAPQSGKSHHTITASITFQAKDEKFRWLNKVFGLLEGDAKIENAERWRIRAFECINPFGSNMR
ncbi:MAG TPA: hypothetical protein VFE98_04585 [Candidatus Bathyarchaeia archaeon]|nr:hypothetical protein [Candidatus Bathyarchaeia archaeon]